MRKFFFPILTLIYSIVTLWLVSVADDNYFGPDRKGTIVISVIVYVVFVVLYLFLNWFKKSRK